MQSKVLIVTLVLVGMTAYISARCQPKKPMANYSPNYLQGKFYLISTEKAYTYPDIEDHCGTAEVDDASLQNFPYLMTYQDNNGTLQKIYVNFENTSPPGSFHESGGGGLSIDSVVLGAIQGKAVVLYACNPENYKDAVWIYYATRVSGFHKLDAETRRYVTQVLADNNIPTNDLYDIDNSNCNND